MRPTDTGCGLRGKVQSLLREREAGRWMLALLLTIPTHLLLRGEARRVTSAIFTLWNVLVRCEGTPRRHPTRRRELHR